MADGTRPGDVAVFTSSSNARSVTFVADRRGRASVVDEIRVSAGVLSTCGVVRAGDVLVTLNGVDVATSTFDEVQKALGSLVGRCQLVFRPPGEHYHLAPAASGEQTWTLRGGVLSGWLQVKKKVNPLKPWMTRFFVLDTSRGHLRRYHSPLEWEHKPDVCRSTPLTSITRVEDAALKDNARKLILRLNVTCVDGSIQRLRAESEHTCRVWSSLLALHIGQTGRTEQDALRPPVTPKRGIAVADAVQSATTTASDFTVGASPLSPPARSPPSRSPTRSPSASPPAVPATRGLRAPRTSSESVPSPRGHHGRGVSSGVDFDLVSDSEDDDCGPTPVEPSPFSVLLAGSAMGDSKLPSTSPSPSPDSSLSSTDSPPPIRAPRAAAGATTTPAVNPPPRDSNPSTSSAPAHYMLPTSSSRARSPRLRRGSGDTPSANSTASVPRARRLTTGPGERASQQRKTSSNTRATVSGAGARPLAHRRPSAERQRARHGRGGQRSGRGRGVDPAVVHGWIVAGGDKSPPRIRGGGGRRSRGTDDGSTGGRSGGVRSTTPTTANTAGAPPPKSATPPPQRPPVSQTPPRHPEQAPAAVKPWLDPDVDLTTPFAHSFALHLLSMQLGGKPTPSAGAIEVEPGLCVKFSTVNLLHIFNGGATKRAMYYDQAGPQGAVDRGRHPGLVAWRTGLRLAALPGDVVAQSASTPDGREMPGWVVVCAVLHAGTSSKWYRSPVGWDGSVGVHVDPRRSIPVFHYTTDFTTPHATGGRKSGQAVRPGDVLLEVDGQSVVGTDVVAVQAMLAGIRLKDGVMLKVCRPELVRRSESHGGGSRASVASSASRSEATTASFVPHRAPKAYAQMPAAASVPTPEVAAPPLPPVPVTVSPAPEPVPTVAPGQAVTSVLSPLSDASRGSRIPVLRVNSDKGPVSPRRRDMATPGTPAFDFDAEMAAGTPEVLASPQSPRKAGNVLSSPSRIPRFSPEKKGVEPPPVPVARPAAVEPPTPTTEDTPTPPPSSVGSDGTPTPPAGRESPALSTPTPPGAASAADTSAAAMVSPAVQAAMLSPTTQLATGSLGAVQRGVLLSEAPSTADLLRKLSVVKRQLHARPGLEPPSTSPNNVSVASTAMRSQPTEAVSLGEAAPPVVAPVANPRASEPSSPSARRPPRRSPATRQSSSSSVVVVGIDAAPGEARSRPSRTPSPFQTRTRLANSPPRSPTDTPSPSAEPGPPSPFTPGDGPVPGDALPQHRSSVYDREGGGGGGGAPAPAFSDSEPDSDVEGEAVEEGQGAGGGAV